MVDHYDLIIGLGKTLKNSLVLLVPFMIAMLLGLPPAYAWIATPVVYFLKNYWENKI